MNKFFPVAEPSITEREIRYVLDAVKSGWVSSLGHYIFDFEKRFAEYVGVKYALTTTNGTTALHLALASLDIKGGDEVIVPDLTFVAVPNAVAYTGAKPVFVDIDLETWCIDPEAIKKAITARTKAIIPVHLYGHPADMDAVNQIAEEHGLYVIEDAAEAHGAEYEGKKVGSMGHVGVFSFYGNKVITTGEGGMITTDDEAVYERARFLRDHAMSKERRYWHTELGFNYRLTNIQAALGLAQLERIEELLDKKRLIFKSYEEFLGGFGAIRLNPEKKWARNTFWMVCLILGKDIKITRDELMLELRKMGIDTRPFFYPMSQMPIYKSNSGNSAAYDISGKGLNLPSGGNLNRKDIEFISQSLLALLKHS